MIPLATVIDPKLTDSLKSYISKAKDKYGRPIKELGQLGREDFLKFYKQHTTLNTGESS